MAASKDTVIQLIEATVEQVNTSTILSESSRSKCNQCISNDDDDATVRETVEILMVFTERSQHLFKLKQSNSLLFM